MTIALVRRHLILLVVALVFVTLLSGTTSPLHPWYGGDSALFRLIGTAMAHGQTVYLDIWDHKGPVLFLIQWLAQVIVPGRIGIFVLQVLSLYATLALLTTLARRFVGPVMTVAVVVCTLAFLAPAYEHGNLSEEYSLPFIALALVVLTREWSLDKPTPLWMHAAAGAAFSLVVFIRINNALPIFAAFLAYYVCALITRRRFWVPLAVSVAAFAAVAGVLIGGFAVVGGAGAMLDATFLFNTRYARNDAVSVMNLFGNGYIYLAVGAAAVPLIGGLVDAQHRRRWPFLLLGWCLAGCTAVALVLSSTGYFHYLQIAVPGIALGVALALQPVQGRLVWHVLAAALVLTTPFLGAATVREAAAAAHANEPAYRAEVDTILADVPEAERSEIYTWNVAPKYFLMAGTLPVQRYFTQQEWWGSADPRVLDEAIDFVESERPRWILTSSVSDERMRAILASDYVETARTSVFVLFERR